MQRIDSYPTSVPRPEPAAQPSAQRGAAGAQAGMPAKGDRIARPSAAPSPDPNGACAVPNVARDRASLGEGLAIGAGVAAAIVAPEALAASGIEEAGGGAASAAGDAIETAASAAWRAAGTAGRETLEYANKSGGAMIKQLGKNVAESSQRFKSPEAVGEMLGNKLHNIGSTLPDSIIQGAIAGTAAWGMVSVLDRRHASGAPSAAASPTPQP